MSLFQIPMRGGGGGIQRYWGYGRRSRRFHRFQRQFGGAARFCWILLRISAGRSQRTADRRPVYYPRQSKVHRFSLGSRQRFHRRSTESRRYNNGQMVA